MATPPAKESLLAELDRVVRETLTYFEGAGRVTSARVDRWQARDVLMHFIYFHDATAWGMQSVALGGPPWPLPTDADGINEVCRRLHEQKASTSCWLRSDVHTLGWDTRCGTRLTSTSPAFVAPTEKA